MGKICSIAQLHQSTRPVQHIAKVCALVSLDIESSCSKMDTNELEWLVFEKSSGAVSSFDSGAVTVHSIMTPCGLLKCTLAMAVISAAFGVSTMVATVDSKANLTAGVSNCSVVRLLNCMRCVSTTVGTLLGCAVGCVVGVLLPLEGSLDDLFDGSLDGLLDGWLDGERDGKLDGWLDGKLDSSPDG